MADVYKGAVDKGLEGVVACNTKISSIQDVTLTYRGYTIEDLAAKLHVRRNIIFVVERSSAHKGRTRRVSKELWSNMALDRAYLDLLKSLPSKNVHPMAWLRTAVSAQAHWDNEAQDSSEAANKRKAIRLTAKMGSTVAAFDRFRTGKEWVAPNPQKTIAWNFLYMLAGKEPDPEFVKIFDTCLILHADHELNCSAFSARVTASSLSDIYSAVVSAIGALKGPLHAGPMSRS